MSRIERFTSGSVAPSKRLTYWNDICSDAVKGTSVDSPNTAFRAEMWQIVLGDLKLLRPHSDACVVRRRAGIEGGLVLHMPMKGNARFRTGQCDIVLKSGEFILSSAETGYVFDLVQGHETLVAELPQHMLAAHLPRIEDHFCRRYASTSPGGRVFRDFMMAIWRLSEDEPPAAGSETYESGMSEAFSILCSLALAGDSSEAVPVTSRGAAMLRERFESCIDVRLDDPDLGTLALAEEFGVSPRTVQAVYAAIGTTPTAHIQHRRLQRAADALRAETGCTITEIAFRHGFNDSAYFTRVFRRQFGMSPRDWRLGTVNARD